MKHIRLLIIVILWIPVAHSQNRIPVPGEPAPSFISNSTSGKIKFPEDYGDSWKILFSHPQELTKVCTAEIMHLAMMQDDFALLGIEIAVISTSDLSSQYRWKQSMEATLLESTGSGKIDFPIIADQSGLASGMYGILQAYETRTRDVRAVFIIDPENKIRSVNFYPMNSNRNIEDIKQLVVTMQSTETEQLQIPVNWNQTDRAGMNLWYKKGQ